MSRQLASILTITLIFAMTAFWACGGHSYELPKDWPVPQLTLPPEASLTRNVVPLHQSNTSPYKCWMAYVDCNDDWEALVEHIESCLQSLGYCELVAHNSQRSGIDTHMHTYYSPDHLTQVRVSKSILRIAVPELKGGFDSEFTLSLGVSPEPSEMLEYERMKLVPLE